MGSILAGGIRKPVGLKFPKKASFQLFAKIIHSAPGQFCIKVGQKVVDCDRYFDVHCDESLLLDCRKIARSNASTKRKNLLI